METLLENTQLINHTAPKINTLLDHEWLDDNGIGGYASSTIVNCHSRKYHGLLVAALKDTSDRYVFLSKFNERLDYDEQSYLLNFHYYKPGVFIPFNEEEILPLSFDFDKRNQWIYKHKDFHLEKELQMVNGENTVLLKYSIKTKKKNLSAIKLNLKPLLAYRSFHGNSYQNDNINLDCAHGDNYCSISPYQGLPEIKFNFNNKAVISPHPFWYKNFLFKEEEARSYDANDDLACPANFEFELKAGEDLYISISVEDSVTEAKQAWQEESKRRERFSNQLKQTNKIKSLFNGSKNFIANLNHAAQKFIIKPSSNSTDRHPAKHSFASDVDTKKVGTVQSTSSVSKDKEDFLSKSNHNDEYSIIAGYHWFGEWGRDTMISLPGLLLDTNQDDIYKKILRRFLNYQQDGLIPNIIGSPPAYNSVDASLWLFWAVQQLETNTGSNKWIKEEFWEDLKNIFIAYSTSNTDKLRYQENGLIESGTEQDSLSWMDACLDGSSVIPRRGAIVEINALWYNAVCYTEQLAKSFKDPIIDKATEIKTKIEESFTKTFYIPEKKYLGDFYNEAKLNQQLRPNQLLACSLPFSPIDIKIAQEIVEACTQKLLTPFGMRTLTPDDVNYQGHYQGDTHSRDRAYHNGTAWPWLLGPYGEALLRTSSDKTQAKKTIKKIIGNFEQHLSESGITSISEIFDGDSPYQARGCIAQAWSVAEIRRLALLVS